MKATPAEFEQLVELREKVMANATRDAYVLQQELIEEATRTLGRERGQDYARSADIFYQWSREAEARFGLREGVAEEAWQIKVQTMRQAKGLRANTGLKDAERSRMLMKLRREAEEQLRRTLGPEGLELAKSGDQVWLIILTQGGMR